MCRQWIGTVLAVLGITVLGSGCQTAAENGMLGGAALGTAAGALIGSQTADAGKGALIGGALGTIAGGLTGAAIDRAEDRGAAKAVAAQQAASAMSVADVVSMTQSGVSEETIVTSIRASSSSFQLAASDIVYLHNSNVSDRVIQTMMDKRPMVAARPVYVQPPQPVYVVEPYYCPPPRPAIYMGYGYRGGCW